MVAIYWDGFDKYGAVGNLLYTGVPTTYPAGTAMLGEWTSFGSTGASNVNFSRSLVAGRFSGCALRFTNNQSGGGTVFELASRGLNGNYATVVFGIAIRPDLNSVAGFVFTDSGTSQLSILVNQSGYLEVRRGFLNGTLLATYTGSPISVGTYHYIEAQVAINNTTGSWSIYQDNALVLTATNQNTRTSANNYTNGVVLGVNWPVPTTVDFDDNYCFDTTGGTNNTVRGDSRVETLYPTSDSSVQFTLGAAVLGYYVIAAVQTNAPGANQLVLVKVTPVVNATLNSVGIVPQTTSVTAKFRGVAYVDSSGAPGTLLTSGTEVVGTTAFSALTLALTTPQSLTAGTPYWIGYITDTSIAIGQYDNTTSLGQKRANTYTGGAPSPAGSMTLSQPTWSIWGNCSGVSTKYSEVNEVPPGDLLSYVFDATVNHEDLYTATALSSSSPSSIAGVKLSAFMERSDAGARTVDLRIKSGATESGGSNPGITPASGSFAYGTSYFAVDPNTSAAWTASAVNAMLIGQKIIT